MPCRDLKRYIQFSRPTTRTRLPRRIPNSQAIMQDAALLLPGGFSRALDPLPIRYSASPTPRSRHISRMSPILDCFRWLFRHSVAPVCSSPKIAVHRSPTFLYIPYPLNFISYWFDHLKQIRLFALYVYSYFRITGSSVYCKGHCTTYHANQANPRPIFPLSSRTAAIAASLSL